MSIYGDTLTVPKPVYGIDFEKELLTLALRSKSLALKIEKKKLRRSQWTLLLMVTTMW